jgi:hypothetical protein
MTYKCGNFFNLLNGDLWVMFITFGSLEIKKILGLGPGLNAIKPQIDARHC